MGLLIELAIQIKHESEKYIRTVFETLLFDVSATHVLNVGRAWELRVTELTIHEYELSSFFQHCVYTVYIVQSKVHVMDI